MKFSRHTSSFIHPLKGIVLQAFENAQAHDITTLSVYLAGCTSLTDRQGNDCMNAYRTVAEDVLSCLEQQGWIRQDEMGWYRIVTIN